MAIRRDIQQGNTGLSDRLQAQGSTFATGASSAKVVIPDKLDSTDYGFMKDVLPSLTKIASGVMGTANEEAFKQGQVDQAADMLNIGNTVDSAAALIQQASWLTKDAYTQGVKYQEYTEGQLETQAAIGKQAQESVNAGDSLEVFSQKIKPSLANLNKKIAAFGLKGKAKDLAYDQLMSYTVSAQQQYQEVAEIRAKVMYDRSLAQEASSSINMLTNARAPDDVYNSLNGMFYKTQLAAGNFDPKNATETTGKQLLGMLDTFATRSVGSSAEDAMRLDAANNWLYNSDEAKALPVDLREKMHETLNKAQDNMHEYNYNQVMDQLGSASVAFKESGVMDAPWLQRARTMIDTAEADGTMAYGHARTARNKLDTFYTKADKDTPKQYLYINGTGTELDAGAVSSSTADKTLLAHNITQSNGSPQGYVNTIAEGVRLNRPGAITLGAQGIAKQFQSFLGMTTEELEKGEGAGSANEAFVTMGDTWKSLVSGGRFDLASKVLNGIDDPTQRAALRVMWSKPGATPSLGTEFNTEYEALSSSITAGTDAMYNVEFSIDTLDDAFFGQWLSPTSAEWNYAQSEHMLTDQTRLIEEFYNNQGKNYLLANRIKFPTGDGGKGAVHAMLEADLLVQTKTQLLPVSPEMRMAMGGGISASNERITKGLDGVANDVTAAMGKVEPHLWGGIFKNGIDRENVVFQTTRNGIMADVIDDNGKSIGRTKHYSYGDIYKLSTPAADATVMFSGDIKTAGVSFKVQADDGTFGSNVLKTSTLKHLFTQEGYHKELKASDPNRPTVLTFGHGIRPETAVDILGEEDTTKFIASAKDPASVEYQQGYDKFVNGFFTNFKDIAVKAGLPEPTNDAKQLKYTPAYKAIADAMYHGGVTGGGNAMIKILNLAKYDKQAARKLLQEQQFYIQTGKDSGRKEFLMRSIDVIQ